MIFDVLIVIRILVYGLAVYRYTLLFHEEAGPWYVFDWLRHKAGVELFEFLDGKTEYVGEGFFGELLSCKYCLSGWLAIALTIGFYIEKMRPFADAFAILGAIWALAYILFKKV